MTAQPSSVPFMFASGIENSKPTIGHGRIRRDQMEECGHYTHWRTDFAPIADLCHFGVPDWIGNFQNRPGA